MKTMESITSFFRRAELLFGRASSFCGRLDHSLVHSGKRVIVFDYPHILQSADTVEEATTFLLKEKEAGRAHHAGVYQHDTDMWHKMDIDLIQSRLRMQETEDVPQETPVRKAIESITSFFRRTDFGLQRASSSTGFCGQLDQSLVQSGKRVIVFEYPQILHAADSIEEATTFLLQEKVAGRARRAAIYKHDTDAWCEVDTARCQGCLPMSHTAETPPEVAP
jgi:hypothetical protein